MDREIESLCLHELIAFLHQAGKSLSDYHLPTPSIDFDDLHGLPRITAEEVNYDEEELAAQWELVYSQTNTEQKEVLDLVTSVAQSDGQSGLYFIDGPGGTGKTFVENLILAKVRSLGRIWCLCATRTLGAVALSVASSGTSAILLEGGRTSQSRWKEEIFFWKI
jgi:ATP-dependent DNA helicase PIF1